MSKQPFINHLLELRQRALSVGIIFVLVSFTTYFFHERILALIAKPLNQPLFYNSPAGGFDLILKICLFTGFVIILPVCLYHILKFVEPALPGGAQFAIVKLLVFSAILCIGGISFAYFVNMPAALYFLNKFSSNQVQALITTDAYFSFVSRYLAGFGLIFQLPLVLLLINNFRPIPFSRLMYYERYVIVGSFVIAAILTPTPDMINQLIMALPLIFLYQISILLVWAANIGRK